MSGNTEKRIFQVSAGVLVLGLAFGAGLYSGGKRNVIYQSVYGVKDAIMVVFQERETVMATEPTHFLQPARHEGSGVTVNKVDDGALVLISGFFDGNPGFRLMERDGTVVRQWPTLHSSLFPDTSFLEDPPATDWNMDIHGQVILPDGSVVFNFEYGGAAKLGRCGDVMWTLEHPTHHSVERAEGGGYWILGRESFDPRVDPRYPPFSVLRTRDKLREDLILKVSENGEILERKSIVGLLYDNGYAAILTAKGENFNPDSTFGAEIVHSNKISELPAELADAFPDFEAGDLLVSLRGYNMLFVVDPDTWAIKWRQTGPWIRQHDPEFLPDGRIAMFNNNVYFHALGRRMRARADAPLDSNIMTVNPATGEIAVIYGQRPGQEFVTTVRGSQDPLPGGGFIISEHEAGRVFQVDAAGELVWEFINRYDDTQVAEIVEGRVYPASYFTVEDWTCP